MLLSPSLVAQVPISRTHNEMRQGDILRRVMVDYVAPGDRGTDIEWNMGRVKKESTDFLQGISSNGDTIAIFEQDRILHQVVRNETLFEKGEQQRRSYRLYTEERPLIRYPFQYGDSISGKYSGQGMDEDISLFVQGWGYSVADGTGVLKDEEGSLLHVTRIHLFDDYMENYGGQATIHKQRHRYLWYYPGYRYPVMESLYSAILKGDTLSMPTDSVTYMYLPIWQSELREDAANDSVRTEIALKDALEKAQSQGEGPVKKVSSTFVPDGLQLNINYTLTNQEDITFCACDILGNLIGYCHYDNKTAGDWQECIKLSRKPIGNALMLNLKCGEQVVAIKVYK